MSKIKIEQLTAQKKKDFQIPDTCCEAGPWSVWECEPKTFDWHYDDVEKAYIYEGKVTVKTKDEEVEIKSGDFVTFPAGLSCQWDVKEKIRKVYCFE